MIIGSVYTDAVRNQWGGRNAHPTWGLDQYLAAHGYVQLTVSLRGSWGFGKSFKDGLTSYGGPDVEDIQSGARLHDESELHRSQASRSLGFELWRPAHAHVRFIRSLDSIRWEWRGRLRPMLPTLTRHRCASWVSQRVTTIRRATKHNPVYYHTEGLRDPLMIIQGTRDSTVLYSDTVALQERMIRQGKLFELVPIPGLGSQVG